MTSKTPTPAAAKSAGGARKKVSAPASGAAAPAQTAQAGGETRISVSRGFAAWLAARKCSLAFTSYQTGKLFLVGLLPGGKPPGSAD